MKRTRSAPRLDLSSSIVHALYASAIGSDSFPETLASLGVALGGCAVGMSLQPQPAPIWLSNTVFDPARTAIMAKNYSDAATNPMIAIMAQLPAGVTKRRQALVADERYFGSGLYNDVFRPQKLVHEAVACGYRSAEHYAPVGIFRGIRRQEFGRDEFKLLDCVLPHLARSIEIYLRLGTFVERQRHVDVALDSLSLGVVFVDCRGMVWKSNVPAEMIFRANDGLTVRGGQIVAASAAENRALQRALWQELGAGAGPDRPVHQPLPISRPSSRRPYSVLVLPLPMGNGTGEIKSGSVLFVTDPERQPHAAPEMLGRLFDLTPTQASILARLVRGESVRQAAIAMGMRHETARTHLKAILQRTNTHRQSELIRLVMGSSAVLQPEPADQRP